MSLKKVTFPILLWKHKINFEQFSITLRKSHTVNRISNIRKQVLLKHLLIFRACYIYIYIYRYMYIYIHHATLMSPGKNETRVCGYIYTHIYIIYIYIYIYIYFCAKNIINSNCISIVDPFLLNKKDSQSVISNI